MSKNLILTGGCGFIGWHFLWHIMVNTDWNVIILDKLTYASMGLKRINDPDLDKYRHRFKVLTWDLCNPISDGLKKVIGKNINYIVHMAAETHVDNSIETPVYVIKNNVMSTVQILEFAKTLPNLEIFFYFSTDEVYGPALNNKLFKEDERHNPTNPYSASKSAGEQICVAYHNTYSVPVIRINVMNAFGETQHVEKFLPLCVKKVLNNEKVFIHSYPNKKKSGTRFYIHARNISAGVLFLLNNGKIGESYNLTGEKEVSNLELAQMISNIIGKKLKYEMVDFHSTRPGHDLRYGLDGTKMYNMGWKLPVNFDESMTKTIKWMINNPNFLEK